MALLLGINCYVTLAEAEEYFVTRIDTDAWDLAAPEDREKALVTATTLLDDKPYVGQLATMDQKLAWPRNNAVYFDPRVGLNLSMDGVIPPRLKQATVEQALHLLLNEKLLDDTQQTFEKIKVGPIEISDSAKDYKAPAIIHSIVDSLIKPLLTSKSTNRMWWRAN